MIWGAYEEPLQLARVVHNLEHGGIYIFYGDEVPDAVVAELREFYDSHERGTLLAPYPNLARRDRARSLGLGRRRGDGLPGEVHGVRRDGVLRRSSAGSSSRARSGSRRARCSPATTSELGRRRELRPQEERAPTRWWSALAISTACCSDTDPGGPVKVDRVDEGPSVKPIQYDVEGPARRRSRPPRCPRRSRSRWTPRASGNVIDVELADLHGAGLGARFHLVGLEPVECARRAFFGLELNDRRD